MRLVSRFLYFVTISIPFFFILGGPFSVAYSQTLSSLEREIGRPVIDNYSPKTYKWQAQNWAFVQDSSGLLYIGNGGGIMEYDGINWRKITLSSQKQTMALSLAINEANQIFVGGVSEFGMLVPDSQQFLIYHSLISLLPESEQDFEPIYQTHAIGNEVYFIATQKIYVYDGENINIINSQSSFQQFGFAIDGRLYIVENQKGLGYIEAGKFKLIDFGEFFKGVNVSMIYPLSASKWLIGTWEQGLFFFEDNQLKPILSQESEFLKTNVLYKFTPLSDGTIALGTIQRGVLIIDQNGNSVYRINRQSGIEVETILAIFADTENNLWLGTDNGISKVAYPVPFTIYDKESGLKGNIQHLTKFQGKLIAATGKGLYELNLSKTPIRNGLNDFSRKANSGLDNFALLNLEKWLLIGDNTHITVYGSNVITSQTFFQTTSLFRSKSHPQFIYAGTLNGVGIGVFNNGNLSKIVPIKGINAEVRSIVEDEMGSIWLGTMNEGIFELQPTNDPINPRIIHYGLEHGLPALRDNEVFLIEGKVIFATPNLLLTFDRAQNRFIPIDRYGENYADDSRWVYRMAEDQNANIWISSYNLTETICARKDGENYVLETMPFQFLNDFPVYSIYPDSGGITWFGGPDGLVRYDENIEVHSGSFQTSIRQIIIEEDSIISGGHFGRLSEETMLPFEFNSIRFEVSGLSFSNSESIDYQYKLEGFEDVWSNWTREHQRIYTNLSEGEYVFNVRSKNIYGIQGELASFTFEILPPWYRTWWFLTLSIIALLGLIIWSIRYISTRRLIKRVEELELQQKIQKERERISRDLHDNVGAQLTHIITNLDVIAYKGAKKPFDYVAMRLETLGDQARETMQQLRETIWAIKKEQIPLSEFLEKLKTYLRKYLSELENAPDWEIITQNKINLSNEISAEGELEIEHIILSPIQALNTFRIIQEAIQNILKHAEASEVKIRFELYSNNRLIIEVKDDGKGFSQNDFSEGHYGIKNMRFRAKEFKGELGINSAEKTGTIVLITIPLEN